jgi:hypothetical protein
MEQGTSGTPQTEEKRLHSVERLEGTCSEAPAGATERNQAEQGTSATPLTGEEQPAPGGYTMENLEGLTEKVGTLGLQVRKKNRRGSARKRARKVKSAKAPTGATEGGQPLDFQEPGTSGVRRRQGPAALSQKLTSSEGRSYVPGKRQRPSGGTPEGGAS